MAEWAVKRFWKAARAVPSGEGYAVQLDDRPIRTPAGAPLVVPTEALARRIAAEWEAQSDRVDPATMPFTRTANSAIDKVAMDRDAVVAHLSDYGGTDLLSYRADRPVELAERQAEQWDPLLRWAADRFDARLAVTEGVMPVAQDPRAIARLAAPVGEMDAFALAGFHDVVALSGSLVLGLAVAEGRLDAETAWDLSRLDEDWQAEQWGHDAEAVRQARLSRAAFLDAAQFHALATPSAHKT